jgi:hypothetical protein
MAINTTFTSGAILTAAQMNNLPWGVAAKSAVTSNQALTNASAVITGSDVTWTAVSTRLYKITMFLEINITAGTGSVFAGIFTNSATRVSEGSQYGGAGSYVSICDVVYETGLSGSQTRRIQAQFLAGGVTAATTFAAASYPAVLIVEDIGAA